MKLKHRLRWIFLAVLAAVALSSALVIALLPSRETRAKKDLKHLWSQYTQITLSQAIDQQNLQQVNLSLPIYDRRYIFKTAQGSFTIILSRCYNFSNEKLFDGNHSVWFEYNDIGKRFRKTARRIEAILEADPLLCESAETLRSFFAKNGPTVKAYIQQICSPAETTKFDDLLGDLEKLVQEDNFSVRGPFQAVLINKYRPSCVHETPSKLDQQIKARLLSADNEWVYLDSEEIKNLNKIFSRKSAEGEFDITESTFEQTMRFLLNTVIRSFSHDEGGGSDEKKNRLAPSTILCNPQKLEVTCAPPTIYLARMVNYANHVNPYFKHIHALFTGTGYFGKAQKKQTKNDLHHHAIVGIVDTENRKIIFVDPFHLVVVPFIPAPQFYDAQDVPTSERKDLIGYWPGTITSDGPSGLKWSQFLEESRRNLKRSY